MGYIWVAREAISHINNNPFVDSKYQGSAEMQTCQAIWLFLENALKLGD